MARDELYRLRAEVFGDPELAAHLRRTDPSRFTEEVLRLAAERGIALTAADVDGAMLVARRAWTLRWIR